MASNREIVTLQFGHAANHVGTHYWNLQEEWAEKANQAGAMDTTEVMYRETEALGDGDRFYPRLMLCDVCGSLGRGFGRELQTDPVVNSTVETEAAASWQGITQTVRRSQSVEGLSPSFTDFAKWQPYPGRGTQLVPGVWQGVTPFSDFYAGISRDVPREFREGLVDSVRWFLEDCDSPQGIQCFVDGTGGFGSLAAECLNTLSETTRLPITTFMTYAERDGHLRFKREVNYNLALAELGDASDVYCPVKMDHISGSGLLGSALFNATLPYVVGGIHEPAIGNSGFEGTVTTMSSCVDLLTSQCRSPLTALALDRAPTSALEEACLWETSSSLSDRPMPAFSGRQGALSNKTDLLLTEWLTWRGPFPATRDSSNYCSWLDRAKSHTYDHKAGYHSQRLTCVGQDWTRLFDLSSNQRLLTRWWTGTGLREDVDYAHRLITDEARHRPEDFADVYSNVTEKLSAIRDAYAPLEDAGFWVDDDSDYD